jgi:exosortase
VERSTRQLALVGVAGLVVLATYIPTIVWLWSRWTMSVWHNAHGALVPPVVAYLIWLELKAKPELPPASSAWGFAFVVPALLMHVLDTGMHTQLLSAISLVLLLPGLSLLFLGVDRTRSITFPLAFMVFALPIPLSVTERLHLALRHVATSGTANLVPWIGIPVYADGTTLHMAEADLQIGDACSGFSTLYAAAAVACLTAWQARGWKRRLLVLGSAAPLALGANVLRIVLLVFVVDRSHIDVLETWIHPASGMLTFAIALPIILWLGNSPALPPRPAVTSAPNAGDGDAAGATVRP